MSVAIYPALFFTVAMMVTTAYFLMGGLPLLVLEHDTPLDARFVHGFFNLYYKAAILTALGATVSFALWGRGLFAAGCAGILAVVFMLRSALLPAMLRLGTRIAQSDDGAIRNFRRVHGFALLANLLQLAVLVWGLLRLSL